MTALRKAATRRNPPTTPPPETAEFYRQLFVAAFDALHDHDGSFGDDPTDAETLPIQETAREERDRFGYENGVTLASLTAAQDTARDEWTHIKEALEAARQALSGEGPIGTDGALVLVRLALGEAVVELPMPGSDGEPNGAAGSR